MLPLKLHISPCPNDCFIFHALLHGLVDTEGLSFDLHFADIETLNQRAIERKGDVIKASIAVAPKIDYTLLDSGAALGYGNGPIVVAARDLSGVDHDLRVVVPGFNTTAALLFDRYFPQHRDISQRPFHAIASLVDGGQFDLGVLIHEGRFTFADMGLVRVVDLGQLWEEQTGLPIPLGGIFADNRLDCQVIKKVERTIARSTQYAFDNRSASTDFVRSHARELSPQVLEDHINFFVNNFTLSLGAKGRKAISTILESTAQMKSLQ